MTKHAFEHIFFDLDGTLTDPLEGITNSYMYALQKLGLNEDDRNIIIQYMGAPLHDYFTEKHKLESGDLDSAIMYYREYYSAKGLYENSVYEGITALLDKLHLSGRTLYLVTVKPHTFAKTILEHFGLEKYFYDVVGSDLSSFNKSKEELIKLLIETENINKSECVIVGDRKFDITGAKANGISCIGLTYGYGTLEEIQKSEPDYIINNVRELWKCLL